VHLFEYRAYCYCIPLQAGKVPSQSTDLIGTLSEDLMFGGKYCQARGGTRIANIERILSRLGIKFLMQS
jgi:hypothetical protein